jgi:hypothetical protein
LYWGTKKTLRPQKTERQQDTLPSTAHSLPTDYSGFNSRCAKARPQRLDKRYNIFPLFSTCNQSAKEVAHFLNRMGLYCPKGDLSSFHSKALFGKQTLLFVKFWTIWKTT